MIDFNEARKKLYKLSSEERTENLHKALIESGIPISDDKTPNVFAPLDYNEERNIDHISNKTGEIIIHLMETSLPSKNENRKSLNNNLANK